MADAAEERYAARGVSAAKEDVHAAIADQDQGLFPGAFCKIVPDHLAGDDDHCLVVHADTAGTKAALGYLAWREGTGVEVFRGIAQDALVMNLDDCACVGATGPFLVCNTIGRNAKLVPGEVIRELIAGYQDVCDTLAREGIDCVLTGGETADVGDVVRTLDVGCTVAVRLRRDRVVDAARMRPGDRIVGFASTGTARWEDREDSGIGSNGLTAARHEILGGDYRDRYPETWAPELARELVYCGGHRLEDPLPGSAMSIGEALCSPTRTYLPLIEALLAAIPPEDCHALIHCSGGGQTKIGKFGRGLRFVKDGLPPTPPLFRLIRESTGMAWEEMYKVFNMGVRLEAVVPADRVPACLEAAAACAIDARETGRIEAVDGEGNEVVITAEGGTHRYR